MAYPEAYYGRFLPFAAGAPDPLIHEALVNAAREFASETLMVRRSLSLQTAANQQTYALQATQEEDVISILSAQGQDLRTPPNLWPLTPGDPSGWNAFVSPGPPASYAFVPYTSVALFPVPDAVYSITLIVPVQPRIGASVIPDELLRRYDREICDGALAWILGLPNKPWSNPGLIPMLRSSFQSGIGRAKWDLLNAYNADGFQVRRRPFIV